LAEALDARGYGRTRADDLRFGRQQLGAIAGLLLLGAGLFGWLYYGSAAALPALILLCGGLIVTALSMRALGQLVPRTVYRRERWHRSDYLVLAAAIGCAAGWIALRTLGAGALIYNP